VITVGKSTLKDPLTQKSRVYKYSDIPADSLGWVSNSHYKPIPYDLMYLRIKSTSIPKTGWWNGLLWKGLKVTKAEESNVKAWKRYMDY
jgi:hypothetical protein